MFLGTCKVLFEPHDCYVPDPFITAGSVVECTKCKSLWRLGNNNAWERLTFNNEQGVPFEHPMEVLARD